MLRRTLLWCVEKRAGAARAVMQKGRPPRNMPGAARAALMPAATSNVVSAATVAASAAPSPLYEGEPLYDGEEAMNQLERAATAKLAQEQGSSPGRRTEAAPTAAEVISAAAEDVTDEMDATDSDEAATGEETATPEEGWSLAERGGEHTTPLGARPSADTPKSESNAAYRFLLDHIDAEIAALQRRHMAVKARREKLEERHTNRIKELFEFMESPWLLLPAEVPPPLPATGVDVYIKEQQTKRQSTGKGGGLGKHQAEGSEKMFVLACHKNYRGLPAAQKQHYEEAGKYNATIRQELRHRLATGCSRFETFCGQVRECTADMVRQGQVPELPMPVGGFGQRRGGRFGSAYPSTPRVRIEATTNTASPVAAATSKTNSAGDVASNAAVEPSSKATGSRSRKTVKRAVGKASKRIAKAAKQTKKRATAAASSPSRGKPANKKRPSGGVSPSIPLPNINLLALKKLKKFATPPKAAAKRSSTLPKPKSKPTATKKPAAKAKHAAKKGGAAKRKR